MSHEPPPRVQLNLRMPRELKRRLEDLADEAWRRERRYVSTNEYVCRVLQEHVANVEMWRDDERDPN